MKTTACIRTMDCGYAICSTFLPGDRQIAVGTKSGEILIYDIASSSLVDTIQAHSATVWSIHVRPDEQGLVSGSADKDVKFWEFERKPVDSENVSHNPLRRLSSRLFRCSLAVRAYLPSCTYGHSR